MTEEERRQLKTFESSVLLLLQEYKELSKQLEALKEESELKDIEIELLKEELKQSKDNYTSLKIARMMEFNASDIKEARQRITRLVREVNKCISLLVADEDPIVKNDNNGNG